MVLFGAIAANGLTLLNGLSFIGRSVQQQALIELRNEERLVRVMFVHTHGVRNSSGLAEALAHRFRGHLGFFPVSQSGSIDPGKLAAFLPPAFVADLISAPRQEFREISINGKIWFALYAPIDDSKLPDLAPIIRPNGILLLAIPRS